LTQGGTVVIYEDFIILNSGTIGIVELEEEQLYVSQNYPNPFSDKTLIDVYVPDSDHFRVDVYDMAGQRLTSSENFLEQGMHQYTFYGSGLQNYILTVSSTSFKQQQLMVQVGKSDRANAMITYGGHRVQTKTYTTSFEPNFLYEPGDELRFTGFATSAFNNPGHDIIIDAPTSDNDYVFEIVFPLYNLILTADPDSAGTVAGGGEYQENQQVTIVATAATGWEFVNWTGDVEYLNNPDAASTMVSMSDQNISLTANFQEKENLDFGFVTDIDGNVYKTVIIGYQEWMAENLRVTRYNNGDSIPNGLGDATWQNTIEGAYAVYPHADVDGINSEEEMVDAYGKLYNWYAVDDSRGLCPVGWSVPSDDDWTQLIDFVVGQGFPNHLENYQNGAGNALKSCRQTTTPLGGDCVTAEHPRWESDDTFFFYGFDEFGFNALPGGNFWNQSGYTGFNGLGTNGYWWSSTEVDGGRARYRGMRRGSGRVVSSFAWDNKPSGYSLRCVNDNPPSQTTYNLNLNVNPAGAGLANGAGEYLEGERINISAISHPGWVFIEWSGDTDYLDDPLEVNTHVTMPDYDISLTANFEERDVIYGDGVIDIDGNEYTTVVIGNQEWMAENLRVTRYNNGDSIPTGLNNTEWSNTTDGAYAIYPHVEVEGINSDEEMVEAYGKLYNWYAVGDQRGLCPVGWHIPVEDEWTQLIDYVVAQGYPNEWDNPNGTGNALKSCRQVGSPLGDDCDTSEHPHWQSNDYNYGFDQFGFAALPGGSRGTWLEGGFEHLTISANWWSSNELSATHAAYFSIFGSLGNNSHYKRSGFSLRCVRETYTLDLYVYPGGAGTTDGAGKYLEGQQVDISATGQPTSEFIEWTGDIEYLDDPSSPNAVVTMPSYDISLVANFE
ncbi:MAG: FISUMP domain-containing protein, partial [Bacteroidota bacterium]